MAWLRIDDRVRTHPKLVAAGPAAAWFWFCGICYCREHLTDGVIPRGIVATLAPGVRGTKALADRLVAAGLWHVHPDGYEVHDFLDWNPTRASVEAQRAADRARKAKGFQPESEPTPPGIQTTPRARTHDAGLGLGNGSRSSSSEGGSGETVGRGDWFWSEWRRLMKQTRGVDLKNTPKPTDFPVVLDICDMVSDDGRLLEALEKFMTMPQAQADKLSVKVMSPATFRMALPKLLEATPSTGVTARTAGNAAALAAFVAKGQPS